MKLRLKGSLFHCGRCGKSYSSPFGHVCATRLDRKPRAGKTRLAPKLTASAGTCPRCRKPIGNPLGHTCTVKTDFKRRTAAASKQDKADRRAQAASLAKVKRARERPSRPRHRYETCQDGDCQRVACAAFKQGRQAGYEDGYPDGYDDGYAAGQAGRKRG